MSEQLKYEALFWVRKAQKGVTNKQIRLQLQTVEKNVEIGFDSFNENLNKSRTSIEKYQRAIEILNQMNIRDFNEEEYYRYIVEGGSSDYSQNVYEQSKNAIDALEQLKNKAGANAY